jgi:hypothetical protein
MPKLLNSIQGLYHACLKIIRAQKKKFILRRGLLRVFKLKVECLGKFELKFETAQRNESGD